MSNVVLESIRTNTNVSVRLALSFVDKKILKFFSFDFRYGHYPTHRIFVNQSECTNIRNLVSEPIFDKRSRHIWFAYAHRVGKKIPNTNRHNLYSTQWLYWLSRLVICANKSPYNFENCVVKHENAFEKLHTSFMKRILDISKYASSKILSGDWLAFRYCTTREHSLLNIGRVYAMGLKTSCQTSAPNQMWTNIILGYRVYNTYCAQMVLAASGQIHQTLDNFIGCLNLVLTTSLFKNGKAVFHLLVVCPLGESYVLPFSYQNI